MLRPSPLSSRQQGLRQLTLGQAFSAAPQQIDNRRFTESRGFAYPATLLLSADSDDRVDPLHARKMAAALQAASSGGPVLLRIERNAGHGGADQVKSAVQQSADVYAFALAHLR